MSTGHAYDTPGLLWSDANVYISRVLQAIRDMVSVTAI
jgi:hypothetical protein